MGKFRWIGVVMFAVMTGLWLLFSRVMGGGAHIPSVVMGAAGMVVTVYAWIHYDQYISQMHPRTSLQPMASAWMVLPWGLLQLAVFLGSMVLLVMSANVMQQNSDNVVLARITWLRTYGPWIMLGAITLHTILTLRISRFIAKDNTMIVIDGSAFYAGDHFTLYPWMQYDVTVIGNELKLAEFESVITHGRDETHCLIHTALTIDLATMQRNHPKLDFFRHRDGIGAEAEAWLAGLLNARWEAFTQEARHVDDHMCSPTDALTKPAETNIGGFLLRWNGDGLALKIS